MKTITNVLLTVALVSALFNCNKSEITTINKSAGAINITNAVIGGTTLTFGVDGYNFISTSNTVGSNASAWFPLMNGQISINLGVPQKPATLTSPAVPAVPYYSGSLVVETSSNYSLFLTGISPAAVESVLVKENYPRTYTDSICGVRFINLAPGSNPISVNIKGNTNGSEVSSLPYKAYSNFLQYPAKRTNTSYIFEFRDALSGDLLTTYTLETPYLHNVTLSLRGLPGSRGVVQAYNY